MYKCNAHPKQYYRDTPAPPNHPQSQMKNPHGPARPDPLKLFDNQPLLDSIFPAPPIPEKSFSDMRVDE